MVNWELSRCCCCISVATGVKILGVLTILSLLLELQEFHPLRMAANGVAAVAFVLMVLDQSEFKRRLFYYGYAVSEIVVYIYTVARAEG